MAGCADEVGDVMLFASLDNFVSFTDNQSAVDARRTTATHRCFFVLLPNAEKCFGGNGAEFFEIGSTALFHNHLPKFITLFRFGCTEHLARSATAAHNSLLKKSFCQGGEAVLLHAHTARTLTHNGDVFGVTAKGFNVVFYPRDSGHLVKQTVVAGVARFRLEFGKNSKAEGTETVVECDANHTFLRPYGNVKMLFVSTSAGKSTAVNVNENREFLSTVFGSKHVEKEAIFAVFVGFSLAKLVVIEDLFGHFLFVIEGARLICTRPVFSRIVHALPRGDLARVFKASCGCIADALVGNNAFFVCGRSAKSATRSFNQIFHKCKSYLILQERRLLAALKKSKIIRFQCFLFRLQLEQLPQLLLLQELQRLQQHLLLQLPSLREPRE